MSKISIEGNALGTGTFTIASPNSNTSRTLTLPDNTGTIITQNSTPAFASTIGVGGATAAASGAGITFPATQSASSDANTLDDYEEGTWNMTVTYSSSTSGVTYTTRTGYYTKVGNFVFVSGALTLSNKGSGSGVVQISLPFTNHGQRGGLAVGNTQSITVNNSPRELMVESNVSYFNIRFPSGSGSSTNIEYGDIANSFYVVFGGCYQVA